MVETALNGGLGEGRVEAGTLELSGQHLFALLEHPVQTDWSKRESCWFAMSEIPGV